MADKAALLERRQCLKETLQRVEKLISSRLEELVFHEDQTVAAMNKGILTFLNLGAQKMQQTMRRSMSSDFQLQRKIFTRNLFFLHSRRRKLIGIIEALDKELGNDVKAESVDDIMAGAA